MISNLRKGTTIQYDGIIIYPFCVVPFRRIGYYSFIKRFIRNTLNITELSYGIDNRTRYPLIVIVVPNLSKYFRLRR